MDQIFHEIKINTQGQGLYDFTNKTVSWLNKQKINNGILNINILHTSASLIIQENADPDVQTDLVKYFDLSIFLDSKRDLCYDRLVKRDSSQEWITEWQDTEDWYFEHHPIKKLVDILVHVK